MDPLTAVNRSPSGSRAMSHGARSSVWRNHFNSPRIKQRDPWCTANGSGYRNQACAFQHSEGSSFSMTIHAPRSSSEGVW
jgi:hypothetical protein